MIRLLFIPLFALILFSCEGTSKEVDPLFYKISEADSVRCMEEILDGILKEGEEWQVRRAIALSKINIPICFPPERFRIDVNSAGQLIVDGTISEKTSDVDEGVFNFFFINRNIKSVDVFMKSSDTDYPGWLCPFYNHLDNDDLDRKSERWGDDMESFSKHDIEAMDVINKELEKIELKKDFLEYTESKTIPIVRSGSNVQVYFRDSTELSNEVLGRVAISFYNLRNYECMRYFKEPYLNLYERYRRTETTLDGKKLGILEILHPATIIIENIGFQKKRGIFLLGEEGP